ncbi:MAG: hypothetical protein ACMG6E_00965 [Candidatus Roizmanbacteria bacterium]
MSQNCPPSSVPDCNGNCNGKAVRDCAGVCYDPDKGENSTSLKSWDGKCYPKGEGPPDDDICDNSTSGCYNHHYGYKYQAYHQYALNHPYSKEQRFRMILLVIIIAFVIVFVLFKQK